MYIYTVKKRDTLWRISREQRVPLSDIAHANNLVGKKIHDIREGQRLFIPGKGAPSPDSKLTLNFRGIDFKEITPKKVKVEHDGQTTIHELKDSNSLTLFIHDHSRGLKVWLEDLSKKMEAVMDRAVVPLGHWNINIDSRRTKAEGELQSRKGAQASTAADVRNATTNNAKMGNGATAIEQTRIESGKPIQAIATIYTSENLRLHPLNEKYRDLILQASKKHGLSPQALAALIETEAAKKKIGKKRTEEWDEKSNENDSSAAQGLCQFFADGWRDVYNEPTSLLHSDFQGKSESVWMGQRLVAKYSIDASAVYAKINLKNFQNKTKYTCDSLPPEDKAKLAYLLHHEGVDGTLRVIGLIKQLSEKKVKERLLGQLGGNSKNEKVRVAAEEKVDALIEQYGSAAAAYKGWLFYTLVDGSINVNHFLVNDKATLAKQPRTIEEILHSLSSANKVAPPPPRSAPPSQLPTTTAQSKETTKPVPPATLPAPSTSITPGPHDSSESRWHDPLESCVLRTAGLASKKSATFGMTRDNGHRAHQGIDLCAEPGTPILAVADGRILVLNKGPKGDYGNVLVLIVDINDLPSDKAALLKKAGKESGTVGFVYAHLSEMPEVSRPVEVGEEIGKTGCTGNAKSMTTIAKGAHLHFEVRLNPTLKSTGLSNRIDPLPFISNCTNR